MERMATAARDAGCPQDQVENFINAGYVPLVGMLPFHAAAREADKSGGPEWVAMGGKRGPGKTHTAMAQALDDCIRLDGAKFLFLRQIQKSARESFQDVISKVFLYTPHEYNQDGLKLVHNDSRVIIGGFKDEKDIDKYLGLEYDGIVIEEATQISETKKDAIRGSLRTSKQWRPRIYLTTNAAGVGLSWFKKMFVEPAREERETNTRFFDVTHVSNPFINPEYQEWLDGLTGPLAKAWRDGDWDAFAGMAFPQWNRERHVVQPFDIPSHWLKWRATDWGFAAPFCTL